MHRTYSASDDPGYLRSEFEHAAFQLDMAILDNQWDAGLFQNLESCVLAFAGQLKGQDELPRFLLQSLHSTIHRTANQMPYMGAYSEAAAAGSNRLSYLFDLLLAGEVPEDRQAGVPRVR